MILYFSGTGNSRFVAQMCGEVLEDEVIDIGEWIKEEKKGIFESDMPWVIVGPTYAWQLPHVFEQFMRGSVFKGSKSAYFIMTCGADIGNAEKQITNICKTIGLDYKGALEVVMPENYIAMYHVPNEQEASRIIGKAIPVIKKGIQVIKEQGKFEERKISVIDKTKSGIINTAFYKYFVKAKKFKVGSACISCGKCVKDCPLNNIELVNGLPIWGYRCTHCMACICGCPTEAIEYGRTSKGQPRYRCGPYKKSEW